jgi:hypothetical protein
MEVASAHSQVRLPVYRFGKVRGVATTHPIIVAGSFSGGNIQDELRPSEGGELFTAGKVILYARPKAKEEEGIFLFSHATGAIKIFKDPIGLALTLEVEAETNCQIVS